MSPSGDFDRAIRTVPLYFLGPEAGNRAESMTIDHENWGGEVGSLCGP